LSYEQIAGKGEYDIRLYKAQKEKLDESIKLKKGLVLELDHEQIKNGGFIPALIVAITSIIGILGGLGAAAGVTAIVDSVKTTKQQNVEEGEIKRHNSEMEKIARDK
jgi:hypothetical protein